MANVNSRERRNDFSLLETENDDKDVQTKIAGAFQFLKKNIIFTVLAILVILLMNYLLISIWHLSSKLSAVEDSQGKISTAITKIASHFNLNGSSSSETDAKPDIFLNSTLWTTHGSCSKLQAQTLQNNTDPSLDPLQKIYPLDSSGRVVELQVVCDFNLENGGGGWTVVQRRVSGPKWEFNKNFHEYESGFGSLSGSFWIGLKSMHLLTSALPQELRIELEDWEGNKRVAEYEHFYVGNSLDMYRLSIGGYSGDAGDSLTAFHDGMRFSTKDNDNDKSPSSNCAKYYHGGYWYDQCLDSSLNGLYYEEQEAWNSTGGIIWHAWKGLNYSLKRVEMKIRDTT